MESDRENQILRQGEGLMAEQSFDKTAVITALNHILELELAGVVRYTHYSFMVYGFGRIPIVSWLRGQADESMQHAHEVGELVTQLESEPSLAIGPLLESPTHDIAKILEESLRHEEAATDAYRTLLELVQGRSVMLEEYATRMISDEARHAGDVRKMLRIPGD
jgi:bacterioferritin